jgi:antitoxin ParD1/3/4
MGTMNISLPDALREFVDQQVSSGAYGTSSEYLRELIRHDRDRLHLRAMLLEGAESPLRGEGDATYFQGLRNRVAASRKSTKRRA